MSRGLERLKTACITVMGSGYGPYVSGTWGSLVALVVFATIWIALGHTEAPRWGLEAITVAGILAASVVSVAWGEWAVEYFRDNDPKQFVLDEFAGQWVALLVLPASLTAETWAFVLVAGGQFVLFRIFDIIKPPPARQAERLPAGWGILTDDLFAGLYANLVGQLLWRATPLASWLGLHLATTHAAGG